MTKIILARHGQTWYNKTLEWEIGLKFDPKPVVPVEVTDIRDTLTPKGVLQCTRLSK